MQYDCQTKNLLIQLLNLKKKKKLKIERKIGFSIRGFHSSNA
jgi:hypothetical protein